MFRFGFVPVRDGPQHIEQLFSKRETPNASRHHRQFVLKKAGGGIEESWREIGRGFIQRERDSIFPYQRPNSKIHTNAVVTFRNNAVTFLRWKMNGYKENTRRNREINQF